MGDELTAVDICVAPCFPTAVCFPPCWKRCPCYRSALTVYALRDALRFAYHNILTSLFQCYVATRANPVTLTCGFPTGPVTYNYAAGSPWLDPEY
jgi:hypothetical protein